MKDNYQPRRVAALAGRRPDQHQAQEVRFPLANMDMVREELRRVFAFQKLTHLVCSAACGADLLALDVALDLGVESYIILPFPLDDFRMTSVTDRPGEWGGLYDKVTQAAIEKGTLRLLGLAVGDEKAYFKTTEAIIEQAQSLSQTDKAFAVVVWEGKRHEGNDATIDFINLSERAGFQSLEILTLKAG